MIHRATHRSLAKFAADDIFQPLGMTHTLFYDNKALVVPNRVAAYDPGENGNFLVDWSTAYDIVGAGGLMSSIDDLLLWDRNFYSNKLGKGTLVKELESHGVLNNGKQIDYAMGLNLGSYRGLPVVEHDGALFGYRAELLRFPQQRFSVAVLCNLSTAGPETLARKVSDLYLASDLEPGKGTLTETPGLTDPSVFAGTYLDPRTKTLYTFTAGGGNLMAWGTVLRRIDASKFYDLGSDVIAFEIVNGAMRCSLAILGELYFSGDRLEPIQPGLAELAGLGGAFHSEEIGATYTLSVEDGRLTLKNQDNPRVQFDAAAQDEFYASGLGTIVFHRDASHRVSGFSLFTQAARGIIFTRVK